MWLYEHQVTEGFAWEAAGREHCGMAGLLSLDSKM